MKKKDLYKKSTKKILKFLLTDKDYLLILFFVVYPILFYAYTKIPKEVKDISLFGFTYVSNYYESIFVLLWTLTGKLLPLLAFSFIFIRVKQLWTYALFIPIIMYGFQVIGVINDDVKVVDEVEFFYCLPIMLVYCFLLYRYRLYMSRIRAREDYEKELVKTGLEGLLKNEK